MNLRALVESVTVGVVLCFGVSMDAGAMNRVAVGGINITTADGSNNVQAGGINRVQANGINRVQANGINRVQVNGINRVQANGINRVQANGINRVQANGISRYRPSQRHVGNSIDEEAAIRGKIIDPQGQGLNQAQINAMELQRQLLVNSTGGGMTYQYH